jgi:hypothetical protein
MRKYWALVAQALGFAFIACTLPVIARAQPVPAPTPTSTPLFTYSGDLRAYYFGRTNGNTCFTCKTKGTPDATAFESGALLHGQINIPHTPFSLAGTYFGAYPFGANAPGPLHNVGYNPLVDNTLPGYPLSLWGEYYGQYKTAGMLFQSGREVINTPWANASDSRVTPISFQGTLISGNITPDLSLGAMYMARFRSRVESAFDSNTLLTSCNTAYSTGKAPAQGLPGTFTVPGDPCNKQQTTSGFGEGSLGYKFGNSGFSVGANQYEIYDIVDMTWVTAQYAFAKAWALAPYLAGQYLDENNIGTSYVGTVHAHMSGGQFGANVYRNLLFTLGYDGSPRTTSIVPKKMCGGTPSSPTGAAPNVIFGGVADTSVTSVPAGDVACYGGGIASPYTDSLATDPLYTTSLTQGLADVHKPGTGLKAALAWAGYNGRLRLQVSQAWYDYWLPGFNKTTSNVDYRNEFNADIQIFLNPVRPGHPYKGFSIRQRYGDRTQTFSPYDFKYSRSQLEYTF